MKPQPVVKSTICSICDLPWEAHGDKPTQDDCVRLLKAELAKARLMASQWAGISSTTNSPFRISG